MTLKPPGAQQEIAGLWHRNTGTYGQRGKPLSGIEFAPWYHCKPNRRLPSLLAANPVLTRLSRSWMMNCMSRRVTSISTVSIVVRTTVERCLVPG